MAAADFHSIAAMTYARPDQRSPAQLRPVRITRAYTIHAEGSVLI